MIGLSDEVGYVGPLRELLEALNMLCESLPHWGEMAAGEQSALTAEFRTLVNQSPADLLPVLRAIPHLPADWRAILAEAE